MAVPDYQALMLPLLRQLADGNEHAVRDVRDRLAAEFKLTAADRAEPLPSGKQSVFDNRVGWAKTYLDKAGLVENTRRGVYRITSGGTATLGENPPAIDNDYLERFAEFRQFRSLERAETGDQGDDPPPTSSGVATPLERLEAAHRELRQRVEADLLQEVVKASPTFFEKLVVALLVKMGYGGSLTDAGKALGRSGDGGVDGIINEDRLGLDAIYVQAKRWTENTVGRPHVQAFAGSLLGKRGRKGVFITTSEFSREAHEYTKQIDAKIVLIDGRTLASLMVDHGIGVNTVGVYEDKRVDGDYFSEE